MIQDKTPQYIKLEERNHVEKPLIDQLDGLGWQVIDLDGKQHEIDAGGLLATCIQHEIDHLDGVLFIDHISKLKRDRVIKKFTKAAKLGKPAIKSAAD